MSPGAERLPLPQPGRNTIYGAALNYRSTLASLGSALDAKPYGAPPQRPVLYIKPANTWICGGTPIPLPVDVPAVQEQYARAASVDVADLERLGGRWRSGDDVQVIVLEPRPAGADGLDPNLTRVGPEGV